ncbi:MAG: elongation factor Ts [Patescibacteria group bacterium]
MDKDVLEKIKALRQELEAPLGLCKEALESSGGDIQKAKEYLIKKGEALLTKKAGAVAGFGIIEGYIHFNGKVGALVELRSQTDFVAKSDEFKKLAHEIALQVATMKPLFVKPEEIPEDILKSKKEEIYGEVQDLSAEASAKAEKIIEGKLQKWYSDICLLNQYYFKDEKMKIQDLISQIANNFGEKIKVRRFTRLSISE